jgi:hypothetical protein
MVGFINNLIEINYIAYLLFLSKKGVKKYVFKRSQYVPLNAT